MKIFKKTAKFIIYLALAAIFFALIPVIDYIRISSISNDVKADEIAYTLQMHIMLIIIAAVPTVLIFKRAGINIYYTTIIFSGGYGLIVSVFLLAFKKWPNVEKKNA